jgi:hypothetical protein
VKRIIIFSLVLIIFLFNSFSFVEARRGCCSHHGGVCGCFCCDGTPLSSACLPYYPQCLNNNEQTQEEIYIPKYQIQPTNTPIILPTNTPIPTPTSSSTPTLTPTLTQTPTLSITQKPKKSTKKQNKKNTKNKKTKKTFWQWIFGGK